MRSEPIVALFILDENGEGDWRLGGASRWWLHHALSDLKNELEAIGLKLVIHKGPSHEVLKAVLADTGGGAVYWNRRYEPQVIQRDQKIKTALSADGCDVQSFNAALLFEPWEIKNKAGKPFQVFTPYWKHCLFQLRPEPVTVDIKEARGFDHGIRSLAIGELNLLPTINWDHGFYEFWEPTAKSVRERLEVFASVGAADYATMRDRPDCNGTSKLSPFLHWGQIGPREVFAAFERHGTTNQKSARKYLAEIGWREFSYHLLYHFPHLPDEPLREEFAHFPWTLNEEFLGAWQKGATGYPIVDAGMRELWATGWMHNRVRMVVASLLVKHLQIHWREGARWFWDTLVDADLASNTQGWQWTAGCGADASPYFRVFNPILQGKKFDPDGDYVRHWIPEIAHLSTEVIHEPWKVRDKDYPDPIVDHKEGRARALFAYEKLKAMRA